MIWKKSEVDEAATRPTSPPQAPPAPSARGQQSAQEAALIGPSIEIMGSVAGDEDLLIEGKIEGKVELRKHNVTIGKSGSVRADICGGTIVVMGQVEGNLYAEEKIVLRQTSTVKGNLLAPRVSLEDGSNFKGSIDMSSGVAEAPDHLSSGLKPTALQTLPREQVADKV